MVGRLAGPGKVIGPAWGIWVSGLVVTGSVDGLVGAGVMSGMAGVVGWPDCVSDLAGPGVLTGQAEIGGTTGFAGDA